MQDYPTDGGATVRKKQPWYVRLARTMGFDPYSKNAGERKKIGDLLKSTSKHARGKVKPADYRAKRKTRRIMARTSRRINRQRA